VTWRRPLGVRAHLLAAMVALALTSVAATALLINRTVDIELARFAERDLQLAADDAAVTAAAARREAGGWTQRSVRALRTVARSRGDTIALVGVDGRPVDGSPSVARSQAARAAVIVHGRLVGTVIATPTAHAGTAGAAERMDRQLQGRMDELLLEAGVVAGVLGLLLAFIVALRMARPLERLTDVARQMEEGHIETRAQGSGGGREMTRLAHTMDRLAAALRRQDELRRATAADVTHELRGALVGLVARIETLQDGLAEDPKAVLARMEGDVRRVRRLVGDVDLLVEAQRPSLLMDKRPIDLGELVLAAVERFGDHCRARCIELTTAVTPVSVRGDPARLAQALDNLLSNAMRYTDPGGRVAIRVAGRGDEAAIEVADSGIGIAPEHLAHVFDRFWRAGTAKERAPDGSGVGLAVVSEIVVGHGGRVDVASRPSRGSTFTVVLPVSTPAPAAAVALPGHAGVEAPRAPARAADGSGSFARIT
jgi:two-component system sensor histidine kinase BaeS